MGDIAIDWPSFFMRMPPRESSRALTGNIRWQLDFNVFHILFYEIEAFREQGRGTLAGSYFT